MSINELDRLAANNVINFDADAYVKGTPPRYVGNPDGDDHYLPLDKPLLANYGAQYGLTPGAQLHGEPSKDAFISHGEEHKSFGPSLPQFLTITSLVALAVYSGTKVKSLLTNKKNITLDKKEFITKIKDGVSSLTKPKELFETAKTYMTNIPKWGKIAGGALAGLFGLYGVYKLTSGGNHKEAQAPHH